MKTSPTDRLGCSLPQYMRSQNVRNQTLKYIFNGPMGYLLIVTELDVVFN